MTAENGAMSRRDELEALLPFYLNGSLTGEDLHAVEAWLANDPEALSALAEAELEYSETSAANEAIRPPMDALSRFSSALEREGVPAPIAARWFAGAWTRIAGLPAGFAWAAAAAALALVLLQAVSGSFVDRGRYEIAGAEGDRSNEPFALVVFKPDARMADVTAFLSENGAAIIDGPTADGVFRIAIPATSETDYDRILSMVAAQPFAAFVTPGRKPVAARGD